MGLWHRPTSVCEILLKSKTDSYPILRFMEVDGGKFAVLWKFEK